MSQKRLLVLGGKPIGSRELVNYAHERGDYVIVADYLSECESPAKGIADESWDVSTADVEELVRRAQAAKIDGVLTGVHEFNMDRMADVANALGLPCYATREQLDVFTDKRLFKKLCKQYKIPVALEYDENAISIKSDIFPLAVKPEDGSGSRGFTKCASFGELSSAIEKAKNFSDSGRVLIEEYIESDAVIIQYTVYEGHVLFSGMTDKLSRKMGEAGAPIMALQIAPSIHQEEYLATLDDGVRKMIASLGIKEGPIWIEAFYTSHGFVLNEAGFRFGGSLTYYPVKTLTGIDQMALLYDYSLGNKMAPLQVSWNEDMLYVIWPVHLHPGKIAAIEGLEVFLQKKAVITAVLVHGVGDEIEDWGSAQQVFLYLHLCSPCLEDQLELMREFLSSVSVLDPDGNNLLYALFDPYISAETILPSFLNERLNKDGE